jgi:hypothetical protein
MQSDAVAVVPEDRGATLEVLVEAVADARMAEAIAAKSLQEARTYLGERQRSWQTAQEQTRLAMNELRAYIDRRAGIDPQHPGDPW